MSRASNAQYRKAARLYHGGLSQVDAVLKAGIYKRREIADTNAYKIFRPETGNEIILAELDKLSKVEFDQAVLSKKEKLEANARLSRGIADRIADSLENEDGEIDHKLIDSYVKLGKRDDVLQGHQIQAETNPLDKRDALLAEWFMETQKANQEKREKQAERNVYDDSRPEDAEHSSGAVDV